MNICFVTSECAPFVKTGGLADVSRALPRKLAAIGHNVKLFLPLYNRIRVFDYGFIPAEDLDDSSIEIGGVERPYGVWYGHLPESDAEVYLIDCPHYFHRDAVYTNDADEGERFVLLQHASFQIMQRYHWHPDIIHANDWQTGLMAEMKAQVYAWDELFSGTRTVLTIHNIEYQGLFDPALAGAAKLPQEESRRSGRYEFSGAFSFLKTGLMTADRITTVSPTYAEEIQTTRYGAGLERILAARHACIKGILNGIDTDIWNPETDRRISTRYSAETRYEGKWANKQALLSEFGMQADRAVPLIGIVSRFARQKGFDLLFPVLGPLLDRFDIQLIVLGSGESETEDFFRNEAAARNSQVGVHIGYSEDLAHRIEAGADMFLMPSHYEPCGLSQMYSLQYGTVPIVRKTGGLADTVVDVHEHPGYGNGFSFYDARPNVLSDTISRAVYEYSDSESWAEIQLRGMKTDFSWDRSAARYVELYESALSEPC